jgi:hypothetical protein
VPPTTTEQIASGAWQYGVLGVVCFVFGFAIIYLFRHNVRRERRAELERKALIEERKDWDAERASLKAAHDLEIANLRTEFEKKHVDRLDNYTTELREDRDAAREHEDQIRVEYAQLMEGVSAEHTKASEALVKVLEKFYDRFVGPRRHY